MQTSVSSSSREKFQKGIDTLGKAKEHSDLLGPALLSLHGALEDQFRHLLSSSTGNHNILDPSEVKWNDLLRMMKQEGLEQADADFVSSMNSKRQEVAHGGYYSGTYQEIVSYSEFVRGWVDTPGPAVVQSATAIVVHPVRLTTKRCPKCQGSQVKSLEMIHLHGYSVSQSNREVRQSQSGLSLVASPPAKKSYRLAIGYSALTCFGTLCLMMILSAIFHSIPLIGGLLSSLVSIAGLLLMLGGSAYVFYRTWQYNDLSYPIQLESWRNTFMCEQCGYQYQPDTAL